MAVILLHILFVVRAELRQDGGLVSAMINGRKVPDRKPVDL
jgi:Ni,Fe-hydrogenase I cytochrome b subunit